MATPDNTQKEGKVVELQEELITKLKELIKVALVNGTSAEDLKSQAEKYIKDFLKEHKDLEGKYTKLYNEWQRVFYSNFNTMYYITKRTADDIFKKQRDKKSEEIYKDLKKAYKDNTKKPTLDKSKESYVFDSNKEIDPENITAQNAPNLKFIRTSAEYGYTQMQIDDYVEKVERVMDKVANLGFVATNKVGARISLRNKAEMEVRYQDMLSDLEAIKEDKFVIVSQHKDASLRCACWQGLIYLKDTDGTDINLKNWHEWNNIKNHITPKPIGTLPNGQPYYSLKDAMEHGLFSYNCRHRFIKYEVGTKVPPQYHYDPNKESEASLIDKKMRQMEEEIRKAKERQNLALTPEERRKWQAKSKALQKKYDEFAKAHGRVRNDWRTSIGRIAERPHMKGIEKGSGKPYISPKKSMKEAGLVRSGIERNEASEKEAPIKKVPSIVKVTADYKSQKYKNKIKELGFSKSQTNAIHKGIKKIFNNIMAESREGFYCIDLNNPKKTFYNGNGEVDGVIRPQKEMLEYIASSVEKPNLITIHNHRGDSYPSIDDLKSNLKPYSNKLIVIGNKGSLFYCDLSKSDKEMIRVAKKEFKLYNPSKEEFKAFCEKANVKFKILQEVEYDTTRKK